MSISTLLIRFLIISAIILLLDWYVFQGIKTVTGRMTSVRLKQVINYSFWLSTIVLISLIIIGFVMVMTSRKFDPPPFVFKAMSFLIMLLIPKLIFILFLLTEDIYRLLHLLWNYISSFFTSSSEPVHLEGRRRFVSQIGLAIASIPFAAILHGMVYGRYKYRVLKETIFSEYLPDEFDGFTITQISDIHVGSFDDQKEVEHGIKMAIDQKSDIILFTGDLVNNKADEMLPWIDSFKKLAAPFGVYSVLGNHDYGDYVPWESEQAKNNNLEQLKQIQKELGFRLLLNENVEIKKGDAKISLIGVENWGKGFKQKGDLKKAIAGIDDSLFKVLMSHDPSHWDEQVRSAEKRIDVTLSGHTHGMQFGIEVPGFKWSPVKYRYPRWAGLFQEAGKYMYVNRGFGYIGFHGRVGIWPEITVITLKKKNQQA
jgi:predicted MPP superfamily phosphohydrolase